jgi:hypothetical protein
MVVQCKQNYCATLESRYFIFYFKECTFFINLGQFQRHADNYQTSAFLLPHNLRVQGGLHIVQSDNFLYT